MSSPIVPTATTANVSISSISITKKDEKAQLELEQIYNRILQAENDRTLCTFLSLRKTLESKSDKKQYGLFKSRRSKAVNHPWDELELIADRSSRALLKNTDDQGWNQMFEKTFPSGGRCKVMYATDAGEMSTRLDAFLPISVISLAAMIGEVEMYKMWFPSGNFGEELADLSSEEQPDTISLAYNLHINSPFPLLVSHRNLGLHLTLFDCTENTNKITGTPALLMYSESIFNDPNLKLSNVDSALKSPKWASTHKQIFPKDRSVTVYLKHGIGSVSPAPGGLNIRLVATVNMFLPSPPGFIIKYIGSVVFGKIIASINELADEIDKAMARNPSSKLGILMADAIRTKPRYSWIQNIKAFQSV